MNKSEKKEQTEIIIGEPQEIKIPHFNERSSSWCKHEKKVIYNPTKKKHCPSCRKLL